MSKMKLSEFNFDLPEELIAKYPSENRDESRLMVVHKDTGEIEHKKFYNITDYMRKNDLLIMNNTKVFPAKLFATKDRTDAKVEIVLLREWGDRLWEVLVKPDRKVRIGNKLILSDGLFCDVIDNTVSGGRVVRFEFDKGNFDDILDKIGHPPLPPYIERPATPKDKERYFALTQVDTINGEEPAKTKNKILFENLTPLFPTERLMLEQGSGSNEDLSSRIIDLIAPVGNCLLYTSPSPRDKRQSRMPSSA